MAKSNQAYQDAQEEKNIDIDYGYQTSWERLKSKMVDESSMDSREENLQDHHIISHNNPSYDKPI